MKPLFVWILFITPLYLFAQKQHFDLATYIAPEKWEKEINQEYISYSNTNTTTGAWCRLTIMKSKPGSGSIDLDFDNEWNLLAAKTYGVKEKPQVTDVQELTGWKAKAGLGKFEFNSQDAMVMVTTISGADRCISIVSLTNSQDYLNEIQAFLESIELNKPKEVFGLNESGSVQSSAGTTQGFAFHTTNFDDGWKSTVHEDWVEVTKGDVKVLLHYPRDGTIIAGDPEPQVNNAWNILVAPRYRNLRNYKVVSPSLSYIATYIGFGNLTDSHGDEVFVALFRKGSSGWMEFISPDKTTFSKTFGVNPDALGWDTESAVWDRLLTMAAYNKFAVAATDLQGNWTSDFGGMQQLYNIFTGQYAGTNTYQSKETFEFSQGNSYQWSILVINGTLGNSNYTNAKSSGTFSVPNNWQVHFSDLEGKPKTFNAYFSCIKGARILWLENAQYPAGYSAYGLKR